MGGQQLGFSCKGNREPLQGMRRGETGEVYSPRDLKWRPGYLSESKPSRAQISGYSRRSSGMWGQIHGDRGDTGSFSLTGQEMGCSFCLCPSPP